jgi:uncharacterized protein (UPF0303 family)
MDGMIASRTVFFDRLNHIVDSFKASHFQASLKRAEKQKNPEAGRKMREEEK